MLNCSIGSREVKMSSLQESIIEWMNLYGYERKQIDNKWIIFDMKSGHSIDKKDMISFVRRDYDKEYTDKMIKEIASTFYSNNFISLLQSIEIQKNKNPLEENLIIPFVCPDVPYVWMANVKGEKFLYYVNNKETKTVTMVIGTSLESFETSIKGDQKVYNMIKECAGDYKITESECFKKVFTKLFQSQQHQIMDEPIICSTDKNEWNYYYIDISRLKEGSTPAWDEFLLRLDFPEYFKCWVGSLMDFKNRAIRRMLWLRGLRGEDGKSTAIKTILEWFYGPSIKSWGILNGSTTNTTFLASYVLGKPFLAYPDNQHNLGILQSGLFMNMLGGDPITVQYKGLDGFTIDGYRRIIVASNYSPEFDTSMLSNVSRIMIIKVKETNKKDGNWATRLLEEMDSFMYACYQTYKTMIENGKNIEIPQAIMDEMLSTIASNSQDDVSVISNEFEFDPTFAIPTSQYREYIRAKLLELRIPGIEERFLTKALKHTLETKNCKFNKGVWMRDKDGNKTNVKCIIGLRLKNIKRKETPKAKQKSEQATFEEAHGRI